MIMMKTLESNLRATVMSANVRVLVHVSSSYQYNLGARIFWTECEIL